MFAYMCNHFLILFNVDLKAAIFVYSEAVN